MARKTKRNPSKYPVKTKRPPKGDLQKRINANMKRLRLMSNIKT